MTQSDLDGGKVDNTGGYQMVAAIVVPIGGLCYGYILVCYKFGSMDWTISTAHLERPEKLVGIPQHYVKS